MANIVLAGLEFHTQAALTRVLDQLNHDVFIAGSGLPDDAKVVFCGADDDSGMALLLAIRVSRPELPVVVVTRHPDMGKWLNALEAGAADYCSAPFDAVQVGWLLGAILERAAPPGPAGPRERDNATVPTEAGP